jgi:hypothetical protein
MAMTRGGYLLLYSSPAGQQAYVIKLQASQFVLGTVAQGVLTTALKEVTEDIGRENFWRRCPPGWPDDKHKADILAICCKKFKVHLKIPVAADVKKKKHQRYFCMLTPL